MSWEPYMVTANESYVPQTFMATRESAMWHNQEVAELEAKIGCLEAELQEAKDAQTD